MVVNIVKRVGGVNDIKFTPLANPPGIFFSHDDEGEYYAIAGLEGKC